MTEQLTVKTEVNIPIDRIKSVLVGAFEQGYDWFQYEKLIIPNGKQVKDYDTEEWNAIYNVPFIEGGGVVVGEDTEDDGTYQAKHTLNKESIVKGLQILADKYPYHFSAIINENDDVNTSDALVQCALLGEVVYG